MTDDTGHDLLVADFDYQLPQELIAQEPLADRAGSRLLVLSRHTGGIQHTSIAEIERWLEPGDLLVVNNTRVLPARLVARKSGTGGRVEFLLLRQIDDGHWTALAKPIRRLSVSQHLELQPIASDTAPARIEIVEVADDGQVVIRFVDRADLSLEEFGTIPLPPYIRTVLQDANRYQTVYATVEGSAAAPTAGLHLTPDLIDRLRAIGVGWAEVTLHIGLDTFRPVTVERVREHVIHQEWCTVGEDVAVSIVETKRAGKRVIAVGTTAARTLETLGQRWDPGNPTGFAGPTSLFITPGYTWQIVDALLTNFHLPRSTLLMMVSALARREAILRAYHEAIEQRYRFYSFGDAMLII